MLARYHGLTRGSTDHTHPGERVDRDIAPAHSEAEDSPRGTHDRIGPWQLRRLIGDRIDLLQPQVNAVDVRGGKLAGGGIPDLYCLEGNFTKCLQRAAVPLARLWCLTLVLMARFELL